MVAGRHRRFGGAGIRRGLRASELVDYFPLPAQLGAYAWFDYVKASRVSLRLGTYITDVESLTGVAGSGNFGKALISQSTASKQPDLTTVGGVQAAYYDGSALQELDSTDSAFRSVFNSPFDAYFTVNCDPSVYMFVFQAHVAAGQGHALIARSGGLRFQTVGTTGVAAAGEAIVSGLSAGRYVVRCTYNSTTSREIEVYGVGSATNTTDVGSLGAVTTYIEGNRGVSSYLPYTGYIYSSIFTPILSTEDRAAMLAGLDAWTS